MSLHPHRGRPMELRDGTRVGRGDPVAEIHFWNQHIAGYAVRGARELTWRFLHDMRADLHVLAAALAAMPAAGRPLAVYAVTPLAEGAGRFGFETRPLPRGAARRVLTWWQGRVLSRTFRPVAPQRDVTRESQEIWLTYGVLQARFGGKGSAS